MAGGRGRRRPNSNDSSNLNWSSGRRRASPSSSSKSKFRGGLLVEGGVLSDWSSPQTAQRGKNPSSSNKSATKSVAKAASGSKSDSRRSNVTAIGYQYPSVEFQHCCLHIHGGNKPLHCTCPNCWRVPMVDHKCFFRLLKGPGTPRVPICIRQWQAMFEA